MIWITLLAVFLGVAAAVGCVALVLSTWRGSVAETRLGLIAQSNASASLAGGEEGIDGLIASLRESEARGFEQTLAKYVNLRRYIQQAGVDVTANRLISMSAMLALFGALLGMVSPMRVVSVPIMAVIAGSLPFVWLFFKRRSRLNLFERQFPDSLDLLARSLRAGHSMADGIRLISEDMSAPIATEFGRCYEQQNLGMPLEDAMEEMTERIPSVDLRFFATAMTLQRQTGGDMVELLEKIGTLIRERFQLRGTVKALTGEGRLSGVVLLALPILLAIYMFFQNPDYLMTLARDPMGRIMVAVAIVLQLIGAVVIKWLVDIKV